MQLLSQRAACLQWTFKNFTFKILYFCVKNKQTPGKSMSTWFHMAAMLRNSHEDAHTRDRSVPQCSHCCLPSLLVSLSDYCSCVICDVCWRRGRMSRPYKRFSVPCESHEETDRTRLNADISVRACHPTPDINGCEGRTEEGEFGKGWLGLGHGKRKSEKDDDLNI